MSVIQMRFFSEALNMFTAFNLILPLPRDAKRPIQPLPTLLLLHGMGDDYSAWLRKTAVERYALAHGLAVVMPDGALSCYENMAHGPRYRDYIAHELPKYLRNVFPVSARREENFIAGCSMGGFGALKLALARPESWSAVGCLSAAHFEYQPPSPRNQAMLKRVYDGKIAEFDAQIVSDAQSVAAGDFPLFIWHSCGDEDVLRPNALISRAFFESLSGNALRYHFEMLSGHHDWTLWDTCIRRFIEALQLPVPEVRLM